MLRALRSPLAAASAPSVRAPRPLRLTEEIAITKSGHLVSYGAHIAAGEQLVKETNGRGGIEKGSSKG